MLDLCVYWLPLLSKIIVPRNAISYCVHCNCYQIDVFGLYTYYFCLVTFSSHLSTGLNSHVLTSNLNITFLFSDFEKKV